MIEQIVFEQLRDNLGVSESFGTVSYLEADPADALPRLVVWQVDDPSAKAFLAYYGGQARVQCDVWSKDRHEIPSLRATVRDALRTLRGQYGEVTITSVVISNEVTRALSTDGIYGGVVDAIIEWTKE